MHKCLDTVQVLLHLQKGSPEHLLSAYGEWFREIASSGHTSWQDYLLDEVSNPLGYCVAQLQTTPERRFCKRIFNIDIPERAMVQLYRKTNNRNQHMLACHA